MLDRILIGSSAEPTDANFKNVTLLLHGDGSNGAQNNTFIDSSTNNFTITRNGNTTQGSFSPYGSNWSNYFDGNGDYLSVAYSSAFNLTGDFTVECWINCSNLPSSTGSAPQSFERIFSFGTYNAANSIGLEINSNDSGNVRKFVCWYNGTSYSVSANDAVTVGAWTHIALVRSGTTITLYVNGVSTGNTITGASAAVNTSQALYVGSLQGFESNTSACFNGYISNFRVVKGTAVYTGTFTPSTTPLTAITNTSLLTCAYNRFRDGSTNNFTITCNGDVKVTNFAPFAPSSAYSTSANSGSIYGDGTGDGLTAATNTAFAFGTGDFTIEFWGYYPGWAGDAQLVGAHTAFVGFDFLIQQFGSGAFRYLDSSLTLSSGYVPPTGSWHHYAVTRSGTTLRIFVDGDLKASGTSTANISSTFNIGILCDTGGSASQVGYMSDVRIVKGTAVYTASFTPPTSPLTAISGTSLLVKGQNAAIFDNSMKNDLETVGNAQISTSVKKFGTGSMYFDGSGDYLLMPLNTQLQLGSGNFTIEFWLNLVSRDTSGACIFANYNSFTTGALSFFAGHATSSSTKYQIACNGTFPAIQSSANVAYNQWDHFAIVRNGNTLTLYINGTADGTFSMTGISVDGVGSNWIVGAALDALTNYELNGYLDEFRITKGVARYTANFTAPTAPFPNK